MHGWPPEIAQTAQQQFRCHPIGASRVLNSPGGQIGTQETWDMNCSRHQGRSDEQFGTQCLSQLSEAPQPLKGQWDHQMALGSHCLGGGGGEGQGYVGP